jgi:predicted DNA-binding antitoxin AbrB/MazE fold protein
MDLRIDAIYENGVLRPLGPIAIPDHARVSLTIALPNEKGPGLNGCLGALSPEAAAEMLGIVEREFERVDPRDW